MAIHSSILLRECHGQKSLVGYSSWSCRVGHNWAHTYPILKTYSLGHCVSDRHVFHLLILGILFFSGQAPSVRLGVPNSVPRCGLQACGGDEPMQPWSSWLLVTASSLTQSIYPSCHINIKVSMTCAVTQKNLASTEINHTSIGAILPFLKWPANWKCLGISDRISRSEE